MEQQGQRRRVATCGALTVVLAALALLAVSSAGATGSYTDPTGDGGATAADVTHASVSSDAAGTIVFRIDATAPTSGSTTVGLVLDTDQNPDTGSADLGGAEYIFYVDTAAHSYDFEHWNGTDWEATPYTTVRIAAGTSGVVISVNKSELGNTSAFNFWAQTIGADGTKDGDTAPDLGIWNYALAAGGPDIQRVTVTAVPARGPVAGHRFTLAPTAIELPPAGAVTVLPKPESYTCSAKLRGKPIAGTGVGGCSWKIPKKAKSRLFVVTLTVNYQGATKSIPFTYRVAKK